MPKVADFGLAKSLATRGADTNLDIGGALTRTGEILGTPGYMPPEQASGVVANVGPPADVYALGAVLYEVLTGRPPFQAPDAVQTLMMVLTRDPVAPRALQPDIPRDLETICLKCLEKLPKKRYETARDLADDLRRFLDGQPIVARPVGTVERAAKWARRNKAAAALVAVSAVAAVLLLGAGVALAVGYFKLKDTNNELAGKNTALDQANKDTIAEKEKVEQANEDIERTLGLTFEALDRYFFEFSDRVGDLPESTALRRQVLEQARRTIDSLAQFRPDHPTILNYQMVGYDRLGNVESKVGDLAAAEKSHSKARDIATKLEARFPGEGVYRRNRVLATAKLASLEQARGNMKASDAMLDTITPEVNRFAAELPDNPQVLELLSVVRLQELARLFQTDRWDAAPLKMRELCDVYRRRAKAEPDSPARKRDVIDGDRRLASLLATTADPGAREEAGRLLASAAADIEALPDRASVETRRLRASVQVTFAGFHEDRKEYAKTIAAYKSALAEYGPLADKYTDRPLYRYEQASTLYYFARAVDASGDRKGAIAHMETTEKLLAELVRKSKSRLYYDMYAQVANDLRDMRAPPKPPDKKP